METLKKQTNGDVNRQIYVETLKKQTNIRGDVEINIRGDVKKQTNLCGEVEVTHKYSRRRGKTDVKETDKYWWRR